MKLRYFKCILVLVIMLHFRVSAQIPAQWPILDTQLTNRFDTVETLIQAHPAEKPYCTHFAGSLLLASTDRGYVLFTPHPPGGLDTTWQNKLLAQVDTMLIMMDTLGYTALEMDVNYPTLVDSFPNAGFYLDFQEKVFAMARNMGFKTIVNFRVTILEAAESYLLHDVDSFYFIPHGTPDTLTTQRFLTTKLQMMQTIIDSLAPDYMTLIMEPNTEAANLYYLVDFSVDSCLSYVNYFLNNLDKKNTILGAGAGTWNNISYFEQFATTNIDYLDYHVYPVSGTCLNPMVFEVDSIAQANGKKIVVSECWCHKLTDAEWAANTNLDFWRDTFYQRDDYNYFYALDTQFTRIMINLSQQAQIDLVNFFSTEYEFGYLTWGSTYAAMSPVEANNINDSIDYSNMYNMQLGPLGTYTKQAIAQINCSALPSGIHSPEPDIELIIYPNPASKQLTVTFDQAVQLMELNNILGQNIWSMKINDTLCKDVFDVSDLPAGVYFVKVITSKGYLVKKFVKEE